MSEYQYYEFRAVDRRLTAAEHAQLRALSTRAQISSHRFVNTYEWGDFKGNPDRLMESHFDLFLYLSNWGTRWFSMRLPKRRIDTRKLAGLLPKGQAMTMREAGENLIVSVYREDLDVDDLEDGPGLLDELAELRSDILEGGDSLFYLGWLMAVESGVVPDDAAEPFPGLTPAPAVEAFADFFCLDGDFVGAASASPAPPAAKTSSAAVAAAIRRLDEDEKNALLMRSYEGDPHVGAELRRRCRDASASDPRSLRTAADLRAAARRFAEARSRKAAAKAAAERLRKEKEEALARERHLAAVRARGASAWAGVDKLIELRQNRAYDKAVVLLLDLRELGLRDDTDDEFHGRIAALRARHRKKTRLLERLSAAGLE